jgi:hypothetical protein
LYYIIVLENTEALIAVSKEFGLGVNADKTKYVVMSRDYNAGRSYNIKTDNSSFERVEQLKRLGKSLANQNHIQEEIKSGLLKSGNSCCHSMQNLLSSSLLSEYIKIKIYGTIVVLLFGMRVKLGISH